MNQATKTIFIFSILTYLVYNEHRILFVHYSYTQQLKSYQIILSTARMQLKPLSVHNIRRWKLFWPFIVAILIAILLNISLIICNSSLLLVLKTKK